MYLHGTVPFAKDIEEATNGRVKIILYPGQTLCKAKDTYEAVKTGIADMGMALTGYTAGRYPVTEVTSLPCLAMGRLSAEIASRVQMEVYYKFPQMQAEFADVKLLYLHTFDPAAISTSEKPVRQLEDLRGLKLRVSGIWLVNFMKRLGVAAVLMPPSSIYENMQKGVIDGAVYSPEGVCSRRIYELAKYITFADINVGPFYHIMNLDRWNALPPDIQEAIESVSGVKAAMRHGKAHDDAGPLLLRKICEEQGLDIIDLSTEEKARWMEAAKPVWDSWVAEMEAKGVPGQEILDEVVHLYEEYTK